ncbi:MAG: cytochrome c maturation protein CcmE [Longimicrobiales bacterium]
MSDLRKRRRLGILVGAVIILIGFTYLLSGQIGTNLVYFLTPAEALAKGPSIYGEPIRLGGLVQPKSVAWNAEALDLRFTMIGEETGGPELRVHASKAPPAMFREGMGVVVEGRMTRAGIFESTNLMVKHSNEYRAPEDGQHPGDMYRTLERDE